MEAVANSTLRTRSLTFCHRPCDESPRLHPHSVCSNSIFAGDPLRQSSSHETFHCGNQCRGRIYPSEMQRAGSCWCCGGSGSCCGVLGCSATGCSNRKDKLRFLCRCQCHVRQRGTESSRSFFFGAHLSSCEADGSYSPEQCCGSPRMCWCVTQTKRCDHVMSVQKKSLRSQN